MAFKHRDPAIPEVLNDLHDLLPVIWYHKKRAWLVTWYHKGHPYNEIDDHSQNMQLARSKTQTHPIFAGISSFFGCWKYMGNAWKIYLSLLQMISKRSLRYIPWTFPWNKIQSSKLSSIVYQCVYIYIYIMHWFYSFIFIHPLLNEILPWYPLLN